MIFVDPHVFLLLQKNRGGARTVEIVTTRQEVLKKWNASTRVSPLYRIKDGNLGSPSSYKFPGTQYLFFMGPLHPEMALGVVPRTTKMWLSIGLYNILVILRSQHDLNKIKRFASNERAHFEWWRIRNGVITYVYCSPRKVDKQTVKILARLAKPERVAETQEALDEYGPLMAMTLCRGNVLPDSLIHELHQVEIAVKQMLKIFSKSPSQPDYQALAQMLILNAGLSRFSSQIFAGTSPIFETECHIWSHSLLGIGVANLALWNIRKFLHNALARIRIPEQFATLREAKDVPDLTREAFPDGRWIRDDYDKIATNLEPLIPLISYFSARDGYKATEWTISAPLAAVSACNSHRWSLMTLTHEVSHGIIRDVLSDLYPLSLPPGEDAEKELDAAYELYQESKIASNLLLEIRRILLYSIFAMECAAAQVPLRKAKTPTKEDWRKMLVAWYHDVDETMTHTFDFLYFYGKEVERYVTGIWNSWGTIPNVSTRVPEYVVRTISAVLAAHLRRGGEGETTAKKQVLSILLKLQTSTSGGRYVEQAIKYIKSHWDDEIFEQVRARRQLVKIVRTFLYSDKISHRLRREPHISGGESDREGYTLREGRLEASFINNPLRFLEIYTSASPSNNVLSVWMLYVLAFCVKQD